MRIPYREKCEKIPQTVRTPNECAGCYASSDLEFHELLDHRAKRPWYELKVNVVIGSVWCIAQSRNVVGIPPIFRKLLFHLLRDFECCCSVDQFQRARFHNYLPPPGGVLRRTCSCVCSHALRSASCEGCT